MSWIQIGWALLLVALLIVMVPRIKAAVENSPKGTHSDWLKAIIPIALVLGFVLLLTKMV